MHSYVLTCRTAAFCSSNWAHIQAISLSLTPPLPEIRCLFLFTSCSLPTGPFNLGMDNSRLVSSMAENVATNFYLFASPTALSRSVPRLVTGHFRSEGLFASVKVVMDYTSSAARWRPKRHFPLVPRVPFLSWSLVPWPGWSRSCWVLSGLVWALETPLSWLHCGH